MRLLARLAVIIGLAVGLAITAGCGVEEVTPPDAVPRLAASEAGTGTVQGFLSGSWGTEPSRTDTGAAGPRTRRVFGVVVSFAPGVSETGLVEFGYDEGTVLLVNGQAPAGLHGSPMPGALEGLISADIPVRVGFTREGSGWHAVRVDLLVDSLDNGSSIAK